MNTVEVCIKVKQEHLLPLMQKLGVDEWNFKKGRVEVDMTMTTLFDTAMENLSKSVSDSLI